MDENNRYPTKLNSILKSTLGEDVFNEYLEKADFTTCCGETIATLTREELLVSIVFLVNEEKHLLSEQIRLTRDLYKIQNKI